MADSKICRTCGAEKPTTEFYRKSDHDDRFFLDCKPCFKSRVATDKASRLQSESAPKRNEPGVCSNCGEDKVGSEFPRRTGDSPLRTTICKACVRIQRRTRRQSDPEKTRAVAQAEYWQNPERRRGYANTQYAAKKDHPDFQAENQRKSADYYNINREEIRAEYRADYAENPFKYLARNAQRRLLLVCDNPYTDEDVADILRMQRGKCAICRKPLANDLTVDHIQALSRGGSNDRRNIQLTHWKCNHKKLARDPIVHMRSLGFLL